MILPSLEILSLDSGGRERRDKGKKKKEEK
jgi:hypothetical protein